MTRRVSRASAALCGTAKPETRDCLPQAVLATRAGPGERWRLGADRDGGHLQWQVRTEDPALVKRTRINLVRFDSPVAPGLLLSDPVLASDRAVKLALCLDALDDEPRAGALGGTMLTSRALKFDWLLRWRLSRGIHSFSALRERDLLSFAKRLATGGSRALAWDAHSCETLPTASYEDIADEPRHRTGPAGSCLTLPDSAGPDLGAWPSALLATSQAGSPVSGDRIDHGGEAVVGQRYSSNTLQDYLAVWDWLWRASIAGLLQGDGLVFDPSRKRGAGGLAGRLGKAKGRTETLSAPQFLRVLRTAAAWVASHGPWVVAALHRPGHCGEAPAALETPVRHVMAACAVLVGGLAARRGGEVASLRAGCLSTGQEGHWASIYIEKTDRAVRPIPVPGSVTSAVAALEALTAPTRAASGEEWLFRVRLDGRPIDLDTSLDLAAFAVASGLHEGEHALAVPLASHQLRRGFAMTFYHPFRLGTLGALREMLRHDDDGSTWIYVSEAMDGATLSTGDTHRARFAQSIDSLTPAACAWLAAELSRLERLVDLGLPLAQGRCEDAALELLREWRQASAPLGSGSTTGSPLPRIRLGSQSGTFAGGPAALLEQVRDYVSRVFPT